MKKERFWNTLWFLRLAVALSVTWLVYLFAHLVRQHAACNRACGDNDHVVVCNGLFSTRVVCATGLTEPELP